MQYPRMHCLEGPLVLYRTAWGSGEGGGGGARGPVTPAYLNVSNCIRTRRITDHPMKDNCTKSHIAVRACDYRNVHLYQGRTIHVYSGQPCFRISYHYLHVSCTVVRVHVYYMYHIL